MELNDARRKRAVNMVWTAANRYDFEPQYLFFHGNGEPDLYLNDGITRIFLNTRGTNDGEVSQELAELLHYIEDSSDEMARTCSSEKVQELHHRVSEVKASEEYGVKYMQAWEEKLYERMDGKAEGLAEGMALAQYLLKAKRYDDLERAVRDPAYRDELCRELDLQKAAAANE